VDDAPMIMASSRSLSSCEWCTNHRSAAEMASISYWARVLQCRDVGVAPVAVPVHPALRAGTQSHSPALDDTVSA
jgi:hypothetical protein